jgi:hypothetical protein
MGTHIDAFFMYPIGLLASLLWLYFDQIWAQSSPFIKYGGFATLVTVTILGLCLSLFEGLRKKVSPTTNG